jgi:superfamily II helicase
MKRLIKDVNRKVFLILDNLRLHHGKRVRAWLDKNKDEIEVFFIPPHSLELNPDKYLDNVLKKGVQSETRARIKSDLHQKTESFLRRMHHNCDNISKLFSHLKVKYINFVSGYDSLLFFDRVMID